MTRPASRRLPGAARALLALALPFLLAAPAARAAVEPAARPVVERYVRAMGGQAFLDLRSVHTRATLQAFGMSGQVESWVVRPDRSASRFQIGPIKMATGYDGATGWRTDPGGKVLRLDGKDLDEMKGGLWLEAGGWLQSDQGGGNVAWVGEESDSAGRYAVLELAPPAGRSRRAYFDLATGLLVKEVSRNDQQTVINRLGDYRTIGAVRLSFRSNTEVVGQPLNTIVMTVDSAWIGGDIPAATFSPPGDAADVRYLKTPGVARLPFEYRARHVWLQASVADGPPEHFIFDTGASITVLDSAYAARIGLATEGLQQGQGAGAVGNASFAVVPKLRVTAADGDGVELKDLRVGVLNVNSILAPYFWRDCAGIIGFDFISRFVDEIDFDRGQLTLYDPATFHYAGQGQAVPMTLAGHTPVVRMKLDGTLEGDFRVDVGSGSTVDLHTPFVKQHDLAKRTPYVEVTGGGFGGTFTTRMVRMRKLEIGPYSWADPLVSLSQATAGAFTSEDYAGNIGNRILERFKVTLDYERRQMWLEPGALYARRDPLARAGMQLARTADTVRVMAVLPGSAGARAGLREGDVVTALDGRLLAGMGPNDVAAVLDEGVEGSTHVLDIVRDGRTKRVKVRLKEML
jgi:hypothetical protein